MNDRADVDILIIGAGVAGATAALAAARHAAASHLRILLVDRADWPRHKVCGCCLGGRGVAAMESVGISRITLEAESHPLSSAQIRSGRHSLDLALNTDDPGLVIGRDRLDAIIVRHAQTAGVTFQPNCSARVATRRQDGAWPVQLISDAGPRLIHARTIIAADGLTGRSLDDLPGFAPTIARDARMGVGATARWEHVLDADGHEALPVGRVTLCVGRGGYVGLVRLPCGAVDIAAALDPALVRSAGGPTAFIAHLLDRSGLHPSGELPERFAGTGLLTRRRKRLAAPGLLVVGDAAGYVEPFTGEGMSWAACGGRFAGMLAVSEPTETIGPIWRNWHASNITAHQRSCRVIAAGLRLPLLPSVLLRVVGASATLRSLSHRVARSLSAAPRDSQRFHQHALITEQGQP